MDNRELDLIVAEKVMGIKLVDWPTGREFSISSATAALVLSETNKARIPKYSTDIADAWEVVEKIKNMPPKEAEEMGAELAIDACGDSWWVGWRWHEWTDCGARADTAPHAICLAALRSVGVKLE